MTSSSWGLVFSGHMIDGPDRAEPRFPASAEVAVRGAIDCAVGDEVDRHPHLAPVVAGAACGGDILFHEVCRRRGIETELVLALPPDELRAASVSFAGGDWDRRFDDLLAAGPVRLLDGRGSATPFDDANRSMLDLVARQAVGFTLLVLWDGDPGDGEGGTADMVRRATTAGGDVRRIDPGVLGGPSE